MFKGYKVVISGATSGIGLATAKKFLEEGATVIGIGRDFKNTTGLGEKFRQHRTNRVRRGKRCGRMGTWINR